METEKEIRLVALTQSGRDVRIELSNGEILELAAESLPPALSVDGAGLGGVLLRTLRDAAQRKQISRVVFNLINRRLMTRRSLREKLADRGFQPALSAEVLGKFAEQGLISDRIFAEAWCRDTLRAKAVGRQYLKSRLIGKGIDSALATEVVCGILGARQEAGIAAEAARKWWARQGGAADARLLAKGIRHLQGRGFAAGLAAEAVRSQAPAKEESS